jgi:hypothetical protein
MYCCSSRFLVGTVVCLVSSIGCTSRPSAVVGPGIDPEAAAGRAMQQYDKDGDSTLSKIELEACPGLLRAFTQIDQDGNSVITEQEIADRIKTWATSRINMAGLYCKITFNGKPLSDARIKFVPENFLEPELKVAQGITRSDGRASIKCNDDELPASNRGTGAMYLGLYRIEITHPTIHIPEWYNVHTVLGDEFVGQYSMTGLPINLSSRKPSDSHGIGPVRGLLGE